MVDSINSANVARLRATEPGLRPAGTPAAGASPAAPHGVPVGAAEDVALSDAATSAISRAAETGPPFNVERVAEIKAAIAEGNYPLDAQRITESFFKDVEALLG